MLAAWDSHDPTETVHNKWKARVRRRRPPRREGVSGGGVVRPLHPCFSSPHAFRRAQVSKHLGTETLLVVADQSGNERGVPFAGSSTIMDLAGPATLAKLSSIEEGLIVQVRRPTATMPCPTLPHPLFTHAPHAVVRSTL